MDILLPHATNALFSIRGEYLVPVGVELPEELRGADPYGGDLSIRLKVPMQVLGHVKAWRHSELATAMVGRAGGPAFVVGARTPPPNVAAAVESYYWKRRESWTVL